MKSGWTKELPKEPGYYWVCYGFEHIKVDLVKVDCFARSLCVYMEGEEERTIDDSIFKYWKYCMPLHCPDMDEIRSIVFREYLDDNYQ